MNTLHLKYAVEIEKTLSITQAAENLYMAQPNLSKAIKELESSLGITIFRRTSKGVIPTDEGVKFLKYAKQILIQIDKMESIAAPEKQMERKIRISVPRAGYISKAFSDYIAGADLSDDVEIYFCETNSLRTIENVRDNGYNFGIIRFNAVHEKYFSDFIAEKNLEMELLWEFSSLAVMSAEHPQADKEYFTYRELSEQFAEIAQGDDFVPYLSGAAERLFAANRGENIKPRRIYTLDRGSAIDFLLTVQGAFMLDSPMPDSMCGKHGLIQRRCDFADNHFRDYIIYASGRKLTEGELSLISFMKRATEPRFYLDLLPSMTTLIIYYSEIKEGKRNV